MSRRVWASLGAAAGIGLVAAVCHGCDSRGTPTADSTKTPAPVRVETVPVTRRHLQRLSEAVPAELMPYEKTDLYAKLSGFLTQIKVDYGDRVKKGEVLATLWIPELEKEHEQKKALATRAEADVKLARAAILAAEAAYRHSKSQYERLARVGRSGVIDQEAVEELRFTFEASKARRDTARADVDVKLANQQVAEADRDRVAALLKYTQIVAPYSGVITRRYLHTGAFINPRTGQQPLLSVVRTDRLRVIVDVPEKDVRYLGQDKWMVVDLDALPGKPGQRFRWPISRMAPVLGGGKKVRVEADLRNPEGTFYPGMYGHAAVILEDKPRALTLPRSCVAGDDKGAFVWMAVGGKATRRRVVLGLSQRDEVEILAGLKEGEAVIRAARASLHEGQAVVLPAD